MRRRAVTALALLLLTTPSMAGASGVRPPTLGNAKPGAVSRPLAIPVTLTDTHVTRREIRIGIEGFRIDPERRPGAVVGSVDYVTDAGDFPGNPIVSGTGRFGWSWDLTQSFGEPLEASILAGKGLGPAGGIGPRPRSTVISFALTGESYHGFRLERITLRLNVDGRGRRTAVPGAVNPPRPGRYRIRSAIRLEGIERAEVESVRVCVRRPSRRASRPCSCCG